jgi:hypothetical protein
VDDLLTTLPCFFLVLVAVWELLVDVPAGVETDEDESVLVSLFLPLSLVTVVLEVSVELET